MQESFDTAESTISKIGFWALQLYIFFYLSRVLEFLPEMRISLILNLIFLGAAAVTGGLFRVHRSRMVMSMMVFLGWVFVCVPFSVWKGGSVETLFLTMRAVIVMACVVALADSTRRCMGLMYVVGYSSAAAGLLSFFASDTVEAGRLTLDRGSFGDPNAYATTLVVGVPFLWLRARNSENWIVKVAMFGLTVPALIAALGTGSRAGFLALLAAATVLFLTTTGIRKLLLLTSAGFLAIVTMAIYPDVIVQRYTTFTTAEVDPSLSYEETRALQSAAGSGSMRMELLRRSIDLTLENPIFGVGPGMFQVAENDYAEALGYPRGMWHQTHNTYTQVSSETGIVGLVLYLVAIGTSALTILRLPRALPEVVSPHWASVSRAAIYMQVAGVALLVTATFLSIAYAWTIFIFVALAGALDRTARSEYLPPIVDSASQRGSGASTPPIGNPWPLGGRRAIRRTLGPTPKPGPTFQRSSIDPRSL